MKKYLKFFALTAFGLLILSSNVSKGDSSFVKEVEEIMQKYNCPGLSVVVVKDNQIIYNHNFGFKDVENRIPVDDQTMFRIASISKSFTATSIMQLVEQGKVSLDTDVSDLAGFKIRNPKYPDTVITLEMLMSHTSSLNDNQGYFSLDPINPDTNPDWAKCYNDYEPGTGYEYCNLNYNLTGTFLEKISGERFDQYVVHHILDPLGVYGGYCIDSLDVSRFSKLYEIEEGKPVDQKDAYCYISEKLQNYRWGYDVPIFSPTGGMKISALDLAKVMIVHMNYGYSPLADVRIISEESSRNMQTERSERGHYGLALCKMSGMVPEKLIVGHTGSAYGLRSAMFFDPEGKYGVVVIANGSQTPEDETLGIHTKMVSIAYRHFIADNQ